MTRGSSEIVMDFLGDIVFPFCVLGSATAFLFYFRNRDARLKRRVHHWITGTPAICFCALAGAVAIVMVVSRLGIEGALLGVLIFTFAAATPVAMFKMFTFCDHCGRTLIQTQPRKYCPTCGWKLSQRLPAKDESSAAVVGVQDSVDAR